MYSNRISTAGRYDLLTSDMKRAEANYQRLTAQLASGKKIVNITDDPIGAVNVINTQKQLGQLDTFNKNIQMGMTEIQNMDDLLELTGSYLNTAWNKAVVANNQVYNDQSLEALKTEIDEIIKTVVDLANTEFNDSFVFAGANTKLAPYTIDDDGNIIYRGTPQSQPYERKYEVADGVFETINTTGDKVFGYYNSETDNAGLLGTLKKLSNGIQQVLDGHAAEDETMAQEGYALMNSTLDGFKSALDTITAEQTKYGGVYNRLQMSASTLETNSMNLTSYLSELQEIDYASAASAWMQAQYAYQASLQVASSAMNMSLLNYM